MRRSLQLSEPLSGLERLLGVDLVPDRILVNLDGLGNTSQSRSPLKKEEEERLIQSMVAMVRI